MLPCIAQRASQLFYCFPKGQEPGELRKCQANCFKNSSSNACFHQSAGRPVWTSVHCCGKTAFSYTSTVSLMGFILKIKPQTVSLFQKLQWACHQHAISGIAGWRNKGLFGQLNRTALKSPKLTHSLIPERRNCTCLSSCDQRLRHRKITLKPH